MTREQAEAKALSMRKIDALKAVKADMRNNGWKGVDIIFSNGMRTGIGNPAAIEAVKKALMEEMERQIAAEIDKQKNWE